MCKKNIKCEIKCVKSVKWPSMLFAKSFIIKRKMSNNHLIVTQFRMKIGKNIYPKWLNLLLGQGNLN